MSATRLERTYRPRGGGMSRGLRRAREPFLLRNTLSGVALVTFILGVYTYAISAVKQEKFDDVDEQALAMLMNPKKPATRPLPHADEAPLTTSIAARPMKPRGILPRLLQDYPGILDPVSKTLVWGAPPIDNIGRIGDARK